MDNQIKELDYLTLFNSFLGVLNYTENIKQTSNDDLMQEIKTTINANLEIIIEQNEEILRRLEKHGIHKINGNK